MRAHPIIGSAVAGVVLGIGTASVAQGDTATWTGGVGSWNTASRWGGTVPDSDATDVFIDGGKAAASSVFLSGSRSVRDLAVDAGDELLVQPGTYLNAYGNVTLNGGLTVDASTLYGGLDFQGSAAHTLGGTGTFTLGSGTYDAYLRNDGTGGLTIASSLNVDASAGGQIIGYGSAITNDASFGVANARTLSLYNVLNRGTISASAGATLHVGGDQWSNAGGTIALSDATAELQGTFTTAGIGAITRTGTSTVRIAGTLDNAGATLALTAATGSYELRNGTVRGGTISTTGGSALVVPSYSSGNIENVTLAAGSTINVAEAGGYAALSAYGNNTINGTIQLGVDTGYGSLGSSGDAPRTLDGTGTIRFNNVNSAVYNGGAGTLTIGPGLTLDMAKGGTISGNVDLRSSVSVTTGSQITLSNGVKNHAAVSATNGSNLYLSSFANAADGSISVTGGSLTLDAAWTNAGTIQAADASVNLGGTFAQSDVGTLQRSGTTTVAITGTLNGNLDLNDATGPYLLRSGTIRAGTITTAGGGTLTVPSYANATLDGATIAAGSTLDVGDDSGGYAGVSLYNGSTLDGTINLGKGNGYGNVSVQIDSPQALAGTGTIRFNTSNSAIYTGSSYTLTLPASIKLDTPQGGQFSGDIDLRTNIAADGPGGAIGLSGGVKNHAVVTATNGTNVNASTFTNAADGTLNVTDGALNLDAAWTNAGAINAHNAAVTLGGTFAQSDVGNIQRSGTTTVTIAGTLNGNLALNDATGPYLLRGGTIRGGTITTAGGGTLTVPAYSNAALDGATLAAGSTLRVNDQTNGYAGVSVYHALTVNGDLRLGGNGGYATLGVGSDLDAALNGTGRILLDDANSGLYNGYATSVPVAAGLTIAGIGSVTGDFDIHGILSPGQSIGTLTFNSGLLLDDGTYVAELGAAAGTSDRVAVNGSLILGGANDGLQLLGGTLGASYVVMTWTGSRIGTFESVTPGYAVTYDNALRQVRVTVTAVPEPATLAATVGVGMLALCRRRRM